MMFLEKTIYLLLILGLVLPNFCFSQENALQVPQTVDEAKSLSMKILSALPGATKKVWQEEAWPFILKMWDWARGFWDSYLGSKVTSLWQKFFKLLGKDTPDLKKEFQKEKEEMEQDFWQRFKELLP